MIIRSLLPHLGDAMMALAMIKQMDTPPTWAGVPSTNALFLNIIETTPVEHITCWDVDLSEMFYPSWDDFAKKLNIKWAGKPAKLIVSEAEQEKHKLPDTGRRKVGICCWSRDKYRSYPHWKELVNQLSKHYDTHVFGLQQLPVRQLVAEVSQMDLFISCDTGLAHIAGSFDIPLIILEGPTDCQKLYSCYENVTYVSTDADKCERKPCVSEPCSHASCMYLIEPPKVIEAIRLPEIISDKPEILLPKTLRRGEPCEQNKPSQRQEKIVIVRMKGVGDVLMTWFGLEILRRQHPYTHITYVTSGNCSELFYGQEDLVGNVFVSGWDYPPEGIPRLPAEIRNIPHDRLIELDNRIDFHDTIEKSLGDRKLLHTSPRADNFAKLLGVSLDGNVIQRNLKIPEEMDKWADNILVDASSRYIGKQAKSFICCQLDAKGATRNWHIDRWLQLSKLLVEKGYGVIWFSTTKEHQYLKLAGVLNLACQTSLAQMIALMSKCQYAISTCSASIHIAHRLENTIPIGIYGSTDYKLLAAYYDDLIPITNYTLSCSPCADWGHECLGQPGSPWCINQISPRKVINALEKSIC